MNRSRFKTALAIANGQLILYDHWMLRFTGLFAILLFLSACATVAVGPHLSKANVRRMADAELRRVMKIDLRQYEISRLRYIPNGDSWSVTYHLKGNGRVGITVRVFDKIEKVSINESDGEIFEGALTDKDNFH